MNGYGSKWKRIAYALQMIQKMTTTVWPKTVLGVPKSRANRSANRPNQSSPNVDVTSLRGMRKRSACSGAWSSRSGADFNCSTTSRA